MQFNAFIMLGSSIDRMWRMQNRIGGSVSGVTFALAGNKFVANDLTPDQYAALVGNNQVVTEVIGAPSAPVETVKQLEAEVIETIEETPPPPKESLAARARRNKDNA